MKSLEMIAEELGFSDTSSIPVYQIKFVPEYRKYCEDNVCGNYDKLPTCPPGCGTFEQLREKVMAYETAFVMKTLWTVEDFQDSKAFKEMKFQHNKITKELVHQAGEQGIFGHTITAGPTVNTSCISAYCIDVSELAKTCSMEYFCGDNRVAFFSMFCYTAK